MLCVALFTTSVVCFAPFQLDSNFIYCMSVEPNTSGQPQASSNPPISQERVNKVGVQHAVSNHCPLILTCHLSAQARRCSAKSRRRTGSPRTFNRTPQKASAPCSLTIFDPRQVWHQD